MKMIQSLYNNKVLKDTIERINSINENAVPSWGKMNPSQMFAHCNVMFEITFENSYKKPNLFMRLILKKIIKKKVTSEVAYQRNSRTAPEFIINSAKNFSIEKDRLIEYIIKMNGLGKNYFNEREYPPFGNLTDLEWNTMVYKHLDHHLKQFNA